MSDPNTLIEDSPPLADLTLRLQDKRIRDLERELAAARAEAEELKKALFGKDTQCRELRRMLENAMQQRDNARAIGREGE